MIIDDLKARSIPDVLASGDGTPIEGASFWDKRRIEILTLLSREIYGFSPPPPEKVIPVVLKKDQEALAGKAVYWVVEIRFDTPKGKFSFPVNLVIPKSTVKTPLFLYISFSSGIPDFYYPVEEIADGGFAVASFCYEHVVPDSNEFENGLAGMYNGNRRKSDDWGKISMWAWAASRVMDYLQTVEAVDAGRIAVVGHSRLGKTALWCAAQDERFFAGISNNSGCGGAAITRGKKGENIRHIVENFSYWFCPNYGRYVDSEQNLPFDQHFLLAAIAPRLVYVASAEQDEWADPQSEYLSCIAANAAYELLGLEGVSALERYPAPGTVLHRGKIGYHLREGSHYLSRYDWQRFMEYIRLHG